MIHVTNPGNLVVLTWRDSFRLSVSLNINPQHAKMLWEDYVLVPSHFHLTFSAPSYDTFLYKCRMGTIKTCFDFLPKPVPYLTPSDLGRETAVSDWAHIFTLHRSFGCGVSGTRVLFQIRLSRCMGLLSIYCIYEPMKIIAAEVDEKIIQAGMIHCS